MGFIDLHCHLLWGVDDGAATSAQSLQMVQGLMALGFVGAAPSPHSSSDPSLCSQRLQEFSLLLAQNDLGSFQLFENAENTVAPEDLMPIFQGGGRLLSGGKFFLAELPHLAPVPALKNILTLAARCGRIPILAHPERCFHFQTQPTTALEAVDLGAHLQLDVMSLVGAYGRRAEALARELIHLDAYALAGSDLHSPLDLPVFAEALDRLESLVGQDEVARLFGDNPRRVLAGEAPIG